MFAKSRQVVVATILPSFVVFLVAPALLPGCNGILGIAGEIVVDGGGASPEPLDGGDGGSATADRDGQAPDADALVDVATDDADAKPDQASIGCRGEVACTRYVFVTAQTFTGHLDAASGTLGADEKCQAAADATSGVLRGRTFLAWISRDSQGPSARLPHGTQPYRRVDGTTVAKDWDELTSGALVTPIEITEGGSVVHGGVWTGTTPDGSPTTGSTCNDWSSATSSMGGVGGDSSLTNAGWTQGTIAACSTSLHLYCVEY